MLRHWTDCFPTKEKGCSRSVLLAWKYFQGSNIHDPTRSFVSHFTLLIWQKQTRGNDKRVTHFRHPTDEQLGHVDIFFSNYYNLRSPCHFPRWTVVHKSDRIARSLRQPFILWSKMSAEVLVSFYLADRSRMPAESLFCHQHFSLMQNVGGIIFRQQFE